MLIKMRMDKSLVRSIMIEETTKLIDEMNGNGNAEYKYGNFVMFDDRSKPYFEWDINCGLCEEWAINVYKRLKDLGIKSDVLGNDQFRRYEHLSYHIFLKIGRIYYDCECLDGVTKVTDLPIYSRNLSLGKEAREKTREFSLLSLVT